MNNWVLSLFAPSLVEGSTNSEIKARSRKKSLANQALIYKGSTKFKATGNPETALKKSFVLKVINFSML